MSDLPIRNTPKQNPYQEFSFVIAAGDQMPVMYDHRYFRVMSLSGGTLKVLFQNSGSASSVIGSGIGIEHVDPVTNVIIYNTHATDAMTITVALSMGNIADSRLSLTGAVTVATATQILSAEDVALAAAAAAAVVLAAKATRKSAMIKNIGANTARLGEVTETDNTRGLVLNPGDTATLDVTSAIYGFSQAGTTLSILEVIT